jgi:hypothetical protein
VENLIDQIERSPDRIASVRKSKGKAGKQPARGKKVLRVSG